jgi:hypothetical protein
MEYFMRRILHLSIVCFAAGIVGACSRDKTIATENIPTAGVRFINAVPDTAGGFGLDFRFVDLVESNAQFRVTYRNNPVTTSGVTASTLVEYKNARAGARRFRVFLDDTLQAVASVVLKDSTITLEAGKLYTVLLMGNARSTAAADRMRLMVIDESVADPGAQVAMRVINTTSSPIDASRYAQGSTPPATPSWSNIPPYSVSTYQTAAPGQFMFNVKSAGTALFADALALPGAAPRSSAGPGGKIDIEALPGTTVAGSAVTAIVFPRSVAGSKAPQSAPFLVPAISFVWDRRPPRPAGI